MASGERILESIEEEMAGHGTPQAITITIVEPSAWRPEPAGLHTTTYDSTALVTSVQAQDAVGQDTSTLVVVPGEGGGHRRRINVSHGAKGSIQTVSADGHITTQELPIISSVCSNEDETSQHSTIQVSNKIEPSDTHGILSVEGEVIEESEEIDDSEDTIGHHCLVCNVELPIHANDEAVPLFKTDTTATQRKMAVYLGILVGRKLTSGRVHSDTICRRCFSLLDRVDSLEVEIKETKEEIVNKYLDTQAAYGGRAQRRKTVAPKQSDYVYPKVVEPEDEVDEVLKLEMDDNFEPSMDDLIEEEQDQQEDHNTQDEEWEPEFRRPRVKREAPDLDPSGQPKRKRGRPRKDASRPKAGVMQRGLHHGTAQLPPTRRIVTVPSAFRKCPHCTTIFMDISQLATHLAQQHKNHKQERVCDRCHKYFVTYEDHSACESCLLLLRQNALPTKKNSAASKAGSDVTSSIVCGHCYQIFDSTVLAELHSLSTGHKIDEVKVNGNSVSEVSVESMKSSPSTAGERHRSLITGTTKTSEKLKHGKKNLIRKNLTHCEVCGQECGSPSSIYTHLRVSHPALFPYECGVCGHRFSTEAHAKDHERWHALGELECPACPLRFSRMSHLHQHTRKHHPNFTEFSCQHCSAVTPTVDALHNHIKVHHGDRLGLPAIFSCEVCQETFHTGKALAAHRSSRHPGTSICRVCGAQVGSRYLKKHINAVHTKEKVYKCDECGKDFYSRTSLTGHQKRYHVPRKHLCHLCGKGYVHNVELQRHLKAHRNQRDFKCDFCGKSFLKATDLTYHRRSHTGERPHQCTLCSEAFVRPLGLRKHMLKHTTIRKGKRLKYSKRKIDELASSVINQNLDEKAIDTEETVEEDERMNTIRTAVGSLGATHLAVSPDITQPMQGFSDKSLSNQVPFGQHHQPFHSDLQHLTAPELKVEQLEVSDLDNRQLEGHLELPEVVDDLSGGELLEMGPGLLLETADVRGGEDDVTVEREDDNDDEESIQHENSQTLQPVEVIYVRFVGETSEWRSNQPL